MHPKFARTAAAKEGELRIRSTGLLASTPFRVTLAYIGAFVLAAALIVSFIAWRANELLTTKVIETLTAENVQLRREITPPPATRR